MAPRRRGAALTVPSQNSSLQQLLGFARLVLQQTARGLDQVLLISDILAASGAATALTSELATQTPQSLQEFYCLWSQPGQDAAAYLALFFLALRRSSLSVTGGSHGRVYVDIVYKLSWQLSTICRVTEPGARGRNICCDLVAPALLRAGALECYSRLLADAAVKLKPAATAALAVHSLWPEGGSAAAVSGADVVAAAAGGRSGCHQPAKGPGQPQNSPASQLTEGEGLQLVNNVAAFISNLVNGVYQSTSGSGGDRSVHDSDGGSDGSGVSAVLLSTGSRGSAASAPCKHPLMHELCTQLHSSWVLEHWAQVLLLSTAVASARDDRVTAFESQARLANWLCRVKYTAGLQFSQLLRRPCGCALAAAHMAQLCAALDGGETFGAAKPEVLVMPACLTQEVSYLLRTDRTAKKYDEVAMRLGRAVDLHAAIVTAAAWTRLLSSSDGLQEPSCEVAGTRGDGACPSEAAAGQGGAETSQEVVSPRREAAGASQQAVSAGQGGAGSSQGAASAGQEGAGTSQQAMSAGLEGPRTSQQAGPAGQEGARSRGADVRLAPGKGHTAAGTNFRKLPPFNRTATAHLCLRLAKGVLACWGRPLSSVRLELPSRNPSAPAPLLPKEQSCALLHVALVCSRLALLSAVWGRERVPRRTRAQLRAWWETYVAAAQHPEALMVGEPEVPGYPGWIVQQGGVGAAPSADATAAIEAGLLPCLTQLVDRMGTGCSSDIVWCPPNSFPGVDSCLAEVLQFGPLGQVGELVSAFSRRLHGSVGELGAAVALEGGGERAFWLGNVVRQAMVYSETCLSHLFLRWLNAHNEGAAADSAGPGTGHLTQRPAAAAAQFPLRSSFALAELLPALSVGVRLCGELVARVAGGESGGGEREGGGAGDPAAERRQFSGLVQLLCCGCSAAASALDCAIALLARLCQEAAAVGSRSGGGGGSAAPGAAGGSGGGGSPSCADAAWRQLLLRDVRLMELLGAGVAMHGELSRAEAAGLLPSNLKHRLDLSPLYSRLSSILPLAALTYPAEFRAAVEGGAGPAGAEASEAGLGAGPSPRPCMSLAAVQAVLEWEAAHGVGGPDQEGDEGLEVVFRVLGGWDPAPGEAWDLARGCCVMYGLDLAVVVGVVRGMPQPEEARAAVAAEAAAADASGSGPA